MEWASKDKKKTPKRLKQKHLMLWKNRWKVNKSIEIKHLSREHGGKQAKATESARHQLFSQADWSLLSYWVGLCKLSFQSINQFYYFMRPRWGALSLMAPVQIQYVSDWITHQRLLLSLCEFTDPFKLENFQLRHHVQSNKWI